MPYVSELGKIQILEYTYRHMNKPRGWAEEALGEVGTAEVGTAVAQYKLTVQALPAQGN